MAYQVTLKVEPNTLKSTASDVSRLTSALERNFGDLQNIVARTSSYWVGAAGDQYRRDFAEQKTEADEILRYLKKYPTDLMTMAGVYVEVESSNTQLIGALSSDIL